MSNNEFVILLLC